ncbi:tetratricopeptide repeat protein [Neolewinella antarctica]|uniref:Tetratricopeptide (TPR) repeat protein n=1 Tax=Neolewinella antarctica TaxID=442734 RepID=A0ABX0XBF9_9BACT|nr:tetratricopeptide repeat protein [Neolewinella antarctica]NJC26595.1 tetratricopeptide (TPR) repeat protein [Neolewinella antarctica]
MLPLFPGVKFPRLLFSLLFLVVMSSGARTQVPGNGQEAESVGLAIVPDSSTTGGASPLGYQYRGNIHYENGEYGRAILAYERGLRLAPGNRALLNNLKFVRGEAAIERPEIRDFFLVRWWRAAGAWFGIATARWFALVCWALAVLGATAWFLRREGMTEKRRFALLPVSGSLLALALVCYLLGSSRLAYLDNDRDGILIARNVELRVAPGPEATLEEELSEGLKLRVLDEFGAYVKISLENGRQGWVPSTAVARI